MVEYNEATMDPPCSEKFGLVHHYLLAQDKKSRRSQHKETINWMRKHNVCKGDASLSLGSKDWETFKSGINEDLG